MGFLKGVKDEITVRVVAEVEGDFGKVTKVPFNATYKRPPVRESIDIWAQVDNDETTIEDVILKYLVAWSDMPGEDGEEVEFSLDNLKEAMTYGAYLKALKEGFGMVTLGKKTMDAAKAKN